MLDGEHADRPLLADDRHAGEAVEQFLAGLGPVGEFGMAGGLVEVEDRRVLGDRSDQALAERELGDVHRLLVEADRGEQLEHAVAQQIDRADLARHRLGDDLHHLVELGLRAELRGHHVVKPGQDLAGGGGGSGGRPWQRPLSESADAFQSLSAKSIAAWSLCPRHGRKHSLGGVTMANIPPVQEKSLRAVSGDRRFQLLVEAVKDYAIYLLDAEGHVASWNSGAQRFKGYKADEIIGHAFFAASTPKRIAPTACPGERSRTAAEEGKFEAEGWRVRKDGSNVLGERASSIRSSTRTATCSASPRSPAT